MTDAERRAYNQALDDAAALARSYDQLAFMRASYRGLRHKPVKELIAMGIERPRVPEPARVACTVVAPEPVDQPA